MEVKEDARDPDESIKGRTNSTQMPLVPFKDLVVNVTLFAHGNIQKHM